MPRYIGSLEIPRHAQDLGEGLALWRNPFNQFSVFAIHYSADPTKATEAWKAEASKGYPRRDWLQEFEISFETRSGRPVFSSFERSIHVSPLPLQFDKKYRVWRGWDIGIHAVVWAQVNKGRLFIFDSRQIAGAFTTKESRYTDFEIDCSGLGVFITEVKRMSAEMFGPDASFVDVVDPAAFNLTMTRVHKHKPSEIFRECGLSPIPGATQDVTMRISLVENWLTTLVKVPDEQPALQPGMLVDPSATLLIDAMAGGYQFEESGKDVEDNGFTHCCDCLEYLCSRLPTQPGTRHSRPDTPVEHEEARNKYVPGFRRAMREEEDDGDWMRY